MKHILLLLSQNYKLHLLSETANHSFNQFKINKTSLYPLPQCLNAFAPTKKKKFICLHHGMVQSPKGQKCVFFSFRECILHTLVEMGNCL